MMHHLFGWYILHGKDELVSSHDAAIDRWFSAHEDLEEEMGFVTAQEDVTHTHHADEDPDDHERLYHFR